MAAAAIAVIRKQRLSREMSRQMSPGGSSAVQRTGTGTTGATDATSHSPDLTGWRAWQKPARRLYNHLFIQVGVAALIGLNFLCNIIQAQIDPTGKKYPEVFEVFELFFNVVFLFELILNAYSTWFLRFWKSGWNIFDFLVVFIGWLFQLRVPLPGPMKLLRMMRAFRVFRLFKRVESLRKIIAALGRAVPGVMNAFLIQLIFICIFAIIAVDRFRDYGEGGVFTNELGNTVELQTARGQDYGFEYYGNFGKALYTMFQVLTGESWSEAVARPMFNTNSATTSMGACFFFVFFSILQGVVLINVVVAVLLEKMVEDEEVKEPAQYDAPTAVAPEEATEIIDNTSEVLTKVMAAKAGVGELTGQMKELAKVSAAMQQRISDVDVIKEQVAALFAHYAAKIPPAPATCTSGATQPVAAPQVGMCSLRTDSFDKYGAELSGSPRHCGSTGTGSQLKGASFDTYGDVDTVSPQSEERTVTGSRLNGASFDTDRDINTVFPQSEEHHSSSDAEVDAGSLQEGVSTEAPQDGTIIENVMRPASPESDDSVTRYCAEVDAILSPQVSPCAQPPGPAAEELLE